MNIKDLKEHLKPFIDLIKESEAEYFWVAGGAIRDYFVTGGNTPKDLDIWFPDKENRNKAIKYLKLIGFESISYLPRNRGETFSLTKESIPKKYIHLAKGSKYKYHSMDIGCWDGLSGKCKEFTKTPQECIDKFAYTIEMAALDSYNKFICHPDYEHHISKNILVIKAKQDSFPRADNRRLLKYIKDGFTIDQENLLLWLKNQEGSFEYRSNINKNKTK